MSPRLRQWADRVHKWVGLIVLPFVVLQAITGAIIVNNERTMQWLDPAMYKAVPRTTPEADTAASIAALPDLASGRSYLAVVLPIDHDFPVLGIASPGGGRPPELLAVDPTNGRLLGQKPVVSNISLLANSWHESLLAEGPGRPMLALVGLALVTLGVTGLIRWWPANWRSALRIRWAGGLGRTLRQAHGPIGFFLSLALLWLGVTGAILVGRSFLEPAAGVVAPITVPPDLSARGRPAPGAVDRIGIVGAATIAREQMPGARLVAIQPMSPISPDHAFVFADRNWRQAYVRVSGGGQVIQRYAPAEAAAASRVFDWMLPLHRGSLLPEGLRALWYVAAAGVVFLAVSGLVTNRLKAAQRRRSRRKAA